MRNKPVLTFILFVVAQMLLTNYFHVGAYVVLTILPVLILCLPTTVATVPAMCIAFASGLAVDFLAEGTLGLNALSLVPVAFIRKGLVGLIFGILNGIMVAYMKLPSFISSMLHISLQHRIVGRKISSWHIAATSSV